MFIAAIVLVAFASFQGAGDDIHPFDFSGAVWHAGPGLDSGPGAQAGTLLSEEIKKRSGLHVPPSQAVPDESARAVILLLKSVKSANTKIAGLLERASGVGPAKPEGFEIFFDKRAIVIVGADARGVLFGVGKLLRQIDFRKDSAQVRPFAASEAPAYRIRGHQLGYRAAANSYDAWDVDRYESYIRDLLVSGCNSVELIPPLDERAPRNRHMPKSEWEMTIALSDVLAKYDMDVWLWPPVEHVDVSKPAEADAFLAKRDKLFRACKRIDAIFIPGGDPGDTPPHLLMPFLARLSEVLKRSHPKATVWVSPQMFQPAELDAFFGYLSDHQPKWLGGVVYGPWVWTSLEETRKRTPSQYPIRNYPDITHTVRCQFAVNNFDQALAFTLGREPINPRPRAYARIHQLQAPLTAGSITYSDGCNDDVNKFLLSVLDWSPRRSVDEALADYARYFFGADFVKEGTAGILMLEDNLVGKAADNPAVARSLEHWKKLESLASPQLLANWRFQQPLFRAYFDAFIAARARAERDLEQRTLDTLRGDGEMSQRLAAARAILAEADRHNVAPDLRKRIWELANDLYRSIGMQLDMKRFGASGSERGAVLDYIDVPLNNRRWLETQFDRILKLPAARAPAELAKIVDYENPGPGGFYDDLGDPDRQPHLVRDKPWSEDPSYLFSPQCEHNLQPNARLSWLTQAQTLYGQPLRMRYTGLDGNARYRLRVVYSGRFRSTMTLSANGEPIHGPLKTEQLQRQGVPQPIEFAIAPGTIRNGFLELEWRRVAGRGCQVAEVWLLRNE